MIFKIPYLMYCWFINIKLTAKNIATHVFINLIDYMYFFLYKEHYSLHAHNTLIFCCGAFESMKLTTKGT